MAALGEAIKREAKRAARDVLADAPALVNMGAGWQRLAINTACTEAATRVLASI